MQVRFCSKSFKRGFSRTWTKNLQIYKLDLEKAEEPEIKLSTFTASLRKQGNSNKTSTSASLKGYVKAFDCVDHNKPWKILKKMGIINCLSCSWEICMWVKKQQFESYMEQLTGSKLGKEYNKSVCCHPVYLTSMQSTSCEMPVWMNHKLDSRLPGEITTSDTQMILC